MRNVRTTYHLIPQAEKNERSGWSGRSVGRFYYHSRKIQNAMINLEVQADFQVGQQMQDLIEARFERIITATVFLRNAEQRHQQSNGKSKIAEIRLEVPNDWLYAEAAADSFEKALAEMSEKMRQQLMRYKEQMSEKRPKENE
jgi:ribosome-associated translation inhibitor RaiA